MSINRYPAAKQLGSILENVNVSHPTTTTLVINESSLNLAKDLVIGQIIEASNQSEKLRSAEVPESRVGYKEPTGDAKDGSGSITLDDNGGYVGNGKDTYYHADRGQNANPSNSDNLAGSKQNYVESSTGKEAAGEISDSGMGAGDYPLNEAMTRTGGSTSTHDEPDAKTIKKMGGIGKPPSIDEYKNTKVATNRKDAIKAISDVFKKFN